MNAVSLGDEQSIRAIEDRKFVDRCVQGDPRGWDELYSCYHSGLVASVKLMLGRRCWDPDLVDEIVARVWYQLVADNARILNRFDPSKGVRLTTFLAMIAKSEASKFFRSEKRRRDRERIVSRVEFGSKSGNHHDLTDAELDEFLGVLTKREQEFLAAFLIAPADHAGKSPHLGFSATNQWKLSSRILAKLRKFSKSADG